MIIANQDRFFFKAAEAQKQTHQGVVLSDRQTLAKLEEDRAKLQDQRA